MKKTGRRPLSEKCGSTTIQVRVPKNVREWFQRQAKQSSLSESNHVRNLLLEIHAKATKSPKKKAA